MERWKMAVSLSKEGVAREQKMCWLATQEAHSDLKGIPKPARRIFQHCFVLGIVVGAAKKVCAVVHAGVN